MISAKRQVDRVGQRQRGARTRKPFTAAQIAVLAALLCLPVYAAFRSAAWLDWRVISAIALGTSLYTYLAYRSDKRRAETGEWRIPEATLHVAELLGGWPGAFVAQKVYRHKTAKVSYQVVFWMIIAAHQFVALDSTLDWSLSRGTASWLKDHLPSRSNSRP